MSGRSRSRISLFPCRAARSFFGPHAGPTRDSPADLGAQFSFSWLASLPLPLRRDAGFCELPGLGLGTSRDDALFAARLIRPARFLAGAMDRQL
jgi:hypothetical protein